MNTSYIVTAIFSYVVGIISGVFLAPLLKNNFKETNYKSVVLLVVSVMWTISVAVEIANPEYKTNPLIHGLMGSIVGFFYKLEAKK
jgi:uncharacterized membrane protein YfcA